MSDQNPPSEPPNPPPPGPPPPGGSPPPGQPQYGGPATPGGSYSPVEAIQYGWARFTKSPATLMVPALIVLVALIVVEVIVQILLYATILGTGAGLFMSLLGAAIGGLFVSFVSQVLGAGLIKSALNVVDGKAVDVGDIMAWATKPNVLATAAIVAGATFVGTLLCYLPGIVIGFLTAFAMFYVVDKDLEPMDAIKASYGFVTGHLAETIVFYLLAIVTLVVGAILCLVGLLAAVPVVLAGAAYTFRKLNNEPVTPAA